MAESEGFEPPEPFGSTVFKTAAFDHSAISPVFKTEPSVYVYKPSIKSYCNIFIGDNIV